MTSTPHTPAGAASPRIRIGLDVGSTTVKAVVLDSRVERPAPPARPLTEDDGRVLFSDYRRHHANVRATAAGLLKDIRTALAKLGLADEPVRLAITGSGGLGLADSLRVPFVQEVIAETDAIDDAYPEADVIIELGGEDAKITYLKPTPEQRMNGSCAGGTGAFIDQMATLLGTDAEGLNEMAKSHTTLYPIASRCGVFAKSDLQPLINDGAAKPDLAASIFQAVSTQTIAGLACGRPVKGNVVFLGGPLFFMSELREAFHRTLEGKVSQYITPVNAHLYVAYGAAIVSDDEVELDAQNESAPSSVDMSVEESVSAVRGGDSASDDSADADTADTSAAGAETSDDSVAYGRLQPRTIDELLRQLDHLRHVTATTKTMRPLFKNQKERDEFNERHHRELIVQRTLDGVTGPLFLGIDAGSTTIKATLVNDDREIVWSSYGTNQGSPLLAAADIVRKIEAELPEGAYIARSCATGYGEGLITAGLHVDEGVVETMAHYRGAELISPGVTSVIDIGGQDMKYLAITNGVIESISVNEACSSGCGSFLQTFATSMGLTIQDFTKAALNSTRPVDLGSRCTVFMNSSVKQAQKEGATIEDIAAGLCYSVVRNALYKVIKLRDAGDLGDTIVVQGGTFLNDAVLRAFELLTDRKVTRPNIAGLMGAYGAALTARMHYEDGEESTLVRGEALDHLSMTTSRDQCKLCQNHCKLTITTFQDGSRYVTGNRCERGGDRTKKKSTLPNLYDYKYRRAFAYRRLTEKAATRGEIGIPRVLNMYENYPFWFTLLTSLGFRVGISGRSNHELFEKGIDSIASENICYPAKLAHGHIKDLLDKGYKTIFYPCVHFEDLDVEGMDNRFNCPIVANYPGVIGANMAELHQPGIRYMHPYFNLANHELMVERIVEEFAWANVTPEEARKAVAAAYAEDKIFKHDVQQEGLRALAYMKEHDCRGIVLAGRPYHVDPEINHGIPEAINTLGMVVLSEDAVSWLEPGRKLNLTPFVGAHEVRPGAKDAEGFRKVDDGFNPYVTGAMAPVRRLVDATGKSHASSQEVLLDGRGEVEEPLRVRNQWAYHARLYAAARFVSEYPGLELVQLNSFGCGLDAITTDQVQEVLAEKDDVYTVLKIDEVSNLGAAKIRLRSLKAAVEEREAERRREAAGAAAVGAAAGAKAHDDAAASDGTVAFDAAGVFAASRESSKQLHVSPAAAASDGFRKTGTVRLGDAIVTKDEARRRARQAAATTDSVVARAAIETNTAAGTGDAAGASSGEESAHTSSRLSKYAHKRVFTKEMKRNYTIVGPQMSPFHFELLESVFRSGGYKTDILRHASHEDIECGLKYVNNDACYPSIIVIGQLVNAIIQGKYDPDRTALVITQTGGMCRATNYYGLIRKALVDAGYPQIPVIALSTQGIESNPGFQITLPLVHRAVKALVLGDVLLKCVNRVRPYEKTRGAANELHRKWNVVIRETIENHGHTKHGREWFGHGTYHYDRLVHDIVRSFDTLPLRDIPRKPRVGVVGEILVKYHPDANNHVVDVIESQGCEAVVPGMMEFMTQNFYTTEWNKRILGTGGNRFGKGVLRWCVEKYEKPMNDAFAASERFEPDLPLPELIRRAQQVTSLGVQAGEGWLLTGEIIELIESGTPNVVCAQPFACLPNHVTGRGMFHEIRRQYPNANIVSIDYDPGSSEANQLNRIKLMIAAAKKMHAADMDTPEAAAREHEAVMRGDLDAAGAMADAVASGAGVGADQEKAA
ncbi:acyl-CoA dehydratase activase-related protein [Pseudoscardovia radai]|uniref:acyl-CoA dehydratase activase-related protein n=1 Tax=Pseudoscardovia radai TaxID=987066 RepID=UPI0039951CAD